MRVVPKCTSHPHCYLIFFLNSHCAASFGTIRLFEYFTPSMWQVEIAEKCNGLNSGGEVVAMGLGLFFPYSRLRCNNLISRAFLAISLSLYFSHTLSLLHVTALVVQSLCLLLLLLLLLLLYSQYTFARQFFFFISELLNIFFLFYLSFSFSYPYTFLLVLFSFYFLDLIF